MAKIIFVAGLPGSGKTYLAKTEYPHFCLLDDPTNKQNLIDLLLEGADVIVADPHLCDPEIRETVNRVISNYKDYDIEWIYFENNPKKCRRNVEFRNDGRNIKTFDCFRYKIPEDAVVRNIWQHETQKN